MIKVRVIVNDLRHSLTHEIEVNDFLTKNKPIIKIENSIVQPYGGSYLPDLVTIITYEETENEIQ